MTTSFSRFVRRSRFLTTHAEAGLRHEARRHSLPISVEGVYNPSALYGMVSLEAVSSGLLRLAASSQASLGTICAFNFAACHIG